MSRFDIKIVDVAGLSNVPTLRFQTEANTTVMLTGEPVKFKANGSPYVIPLADADLVIGTGVAMVGICASDSTQTAAADGYVDVYLPLPGIVYEAKAKTGTTADTQAEINALCGDRVIFDLTSSAYTVDAAAGDALTSPLTIVGGDPVKKTLKFIIRTGSTFLGDQDLA
jgi:hypothetical protein